MRTSTSAPVSDDDLMRITRENRGWRVERERDGSLVMTPPTGANSARRNARLTLLVLQWAEAHGYVAFDSNGGFRLADSSIVGPDASLVSLTAWLQLTDEVREGFFPGPPEVAIELCSKSDDPRRLRAKLARILDAGAKYVVLIDPYRREIWSDGLAPPGFDIDFGPVLD